MSWRIRPVSGDDDLAALAAVVNAVTPEDSTSLAQLRWADAAYPGGVRFLAELGGRAVGAATTGRVYVQPPDFDAYWATVAVVPAARRAGIGSALLGAVSAVARAAGKVALHVPASEQRTDGVTFLVRRGFVEYDRATALRLDLRGLALPAVEPPSGVTITSLAERPDLVAGVHAVAVEAFADIPGGERPPAAGDLAEFRSRDVDRPGVPAEAFAVALGDGGDVVGYGSLSLLPGSTTVAWHDMTAVARGSRGRGIARALKQATIRWAIEHGLEALETRNDEANRPMQALNETLGYRRQADVLTFRGPLAPEAS